MNEPLPVVIVSGPSGSGKSTVVGRLLAKGDLPLRRAVSATTRPPRPGEVDGVHYHFWTRERFAQELDNGSFLESATVHGQLYGSLRQEVEPFRRQGILVILEIDVQGAATIRGQLSDSVSIFLRSSSLATYEERLRHRGTEDEAAIKRRVARARQELAQAGSYDHTIVNDNLEEAVAQLRAILKDLLERKKHA
jgi:guanylate kinase